MYHLIFTDFACSFLWKSSTIHHSKKAQSTTNRPTHYHLHDKNSTSQLSWWKNLSNDHNLSTTHPIYTLNDEQRTSTKCTIHPARCFAICFLISHGKYKSAWIIFCHSLLLDEREKMGKNEHCCERQIYPTRAGSINHVKMACAATNEKGKHELEKKLKKERASERERVSKNPPSKFHFSSFKAFSIVETSVQILILFVLPVCSLHCVIFLWHFHIFTFWFSLSSYYREVFFAE